MNRELISKAISGIDEAFVAEAMTPPGAWTDRAPERIVQMGKHQHTGRRGTKRLMTLLIAAALTCALAATAVATDAFGIRSMLSRTGEELPNEADSFIETETVTAAAEELNCSVTQSLCSSNKMYVTVTVSGGEDYLLVPTFADESMTLNDIGLEGDMSLADYAASQDKQLLSVGATLMGAEDTGIYHEASSFEYGADGQLNILISADRSGEIPNGQVTCTVHARSADGDVSHHELAFEVTPVPTDGGVVYLADDGKVTDSILAPFAVVETTPMGCTVRVATEVEEQMDLDPIKKIEFEGAEYSGGGFVLEDDGIWYYTVTITEGEVGETLTANYIGWEGEILATVVFAAE